MFGALKLIKQKLLCKIKTSLNKGKFELWNAVKLINISFTSNCWMEAKYFIPFTSNNIPTNMFYSAISAEILRIGRICSSQQNFLHSARPVIEQLGKELKTKDFRKHSRGFSADNKSYSSMVKMLRFFLQTWLYHSNCLVKESETRSLLMTLSGPCNGVPS